MFFKVWERLTLPMGTDSATTAGMMYLVAIDFLNSGRSAKKFTDFDRAQGAFLAAQQYVPAPRRVMLSEWKESDNETIIAVWGEPIAV